MIDFFSTVGGQRFVNGTIPNIGQSLERIAQELKRGNDLKESTQVDHMSIQTPGGKIVVSATSDPDYTGVWIEVNGEQVALLDWTNGKHTIRVWDDPNIDPIFMHDVKRFEQE